jgi:DNA-binding MarR family transcriptional regulator
MSDTGFLLRDLARLLTQLQRDEVCNCCGSTNTECTILTELGRTGDVTVSELGRRLGVDKGWISRAVDGLVDDGLLLKQASVTDRRAVLVCLTENGLERCEALNDGLDTLSERIVGRLDSGEREAVNRALRLLYGAVQAEMGLVPLEAIS